MEDYDCKKSEHILYGEGMINDITFRYDGEKWIEIQKNEQVMKNGGIKKVEKLVQMILCFAIC